MRSVDASTTVATEPAATFAFVSDLQRLHEWQSGIREARLTSDGPIGVGSTASVVRELMGQRIEAPLRVTGYEPPSLLRLATEVSGVSAEAAIEIARAASGSRVTFRMEIRGSGFLGGAVEGMVAGAARTDIEQSLERLRTILGAP